MKISHPIVSVFLILTFLPGMGAIGRAQIRPDSPILDFRLPMFGDEGNLVWELRGKEGLLLTENEIDLKGMRLLIFAKDQSDRVETKIVSPAATLFREEEEVRSQEQITVTGDNYVITGDGWTWHADEERVVIDDDVKITFSEELSHLLDVQ